MTQVIYVRAILRPAEQSSCRRLGPKPEDHPTVGASCLACGGHLQPGDYTTLVPLGPGEDDESRERARSGRYFNAVAIEVHWACRTGRVDAADSTITDGCGIDVATSDTSKDAARKV